MAPMGVVSVSPVARQQTSDTTKDSATAIRPSEDRDVKGEVLHEHQADGDRDQPDDQPGDRHFDGGHRRAVGGALALS